MNFIKKVTHFFFRTQEGCMILGAASFGGGLLLGSYLCQKDTEHQKKLFERGIKSGMALEKNGVDFENLEIIIEQQPGVFGKRSLRVIDHTNEFEGRQIRTDIPEEPLNDGDLEK